MPATSSPKPPSLPEALAPLKAKKNWLNYRNEETDSGKTTKKPYQSEHPNRYAKPNDPATWSDFETAAKAVKEHGFDGVGFCLKDSGLAALDCDDVLDKRGNIISPLVQQILRDNQSLYCEVTPSQRGLRFIGKADGPEIHRILKIDNGAKIELYRKANRYITVTGDAVSKTKKIGYIDDVIDQLSHKLKDQKPRVNGHANGHDHTTVNGKDSSGSGLFHAAVATFLEKGKSIDWIEREIETHPRKYASTSASRYIGEGRLRGEIERIGNKLVKEREEDAVLWDDVADPVDLWATFPPPELPRGLLPRTIETFARQESATMGADVAGLAMGALTVCAAAIPDDVQLQVKQHSANWMESARLWVALIGDPSSKKTPLLRSASWPLARIDVELCRTFQQEMDLYQSLPAEERKTKRPPSQRRVRIEDTTIEAAQEVLKDSPDGVLCLQDELSGWFGAMDKYGGGSRAAAKDRGFWLQSFNGGNYVVNRISRGSVFIENLSVSLLGGIQPELMRRLAADGVDDGLLQRVCPIVLRPATKGQDKPGSIAASSYGTLIEALHALRPVRLRFDAEAQAIRQQLEQLHLDLMACEAINRKLAAHFGKYDGIFARLCVIWHCIEHCHEKQLPQIVTADTARRVAKFMRRFLLPHACAFYVGVLGLADDHQRLSAVAGYILAHRLERVTNRDVQRGDRTMRKLTRRDTDQIFEQLEALGWIGRRPGRTPSSAPLWEVNPRVHQLFAERAASEATRRLSIREAIAESLRKT